MTGDRTAVGVLERPRLLLGLSLLLGIAGAVAAGWTPDTRDPLSIGTESDVCTIDKKIRDSSRAAIVGHKPRARI